MEQEAYRAWLRENGAAALRTARGCRRKIRTRCPWSPSPPPPPGSWPAHPEAGGLCFSFLEGSSKVAGKKLGLLHVIFLKSKRLSKIMDSASTEIHSKVKMSLGMTNDMVGNLKNQKTSKRCRKKELLKQL